MAMPTNTRVYRPSQLALKSEQRAWGSIRLALSSGQKKILAIAVGVGLVAGLAATQLVAGHIDSALARVQQLQAANATISNENVRLLAARAQLASKTHIMALAERKLRLFEPVKGQVHRM